MTLLVDIVLDIIEQGIDLEFIRSVEIQSMQFSILIVLVELRHKIGLCILLEELVEFTGNKSEIDLGTFEVFQDYIYIIFITQQ